MKLTWGIYKDKKIEEIPLDYLSWLIMFCKSSDVKFAAKKEFAKRGFNLKKLKQETKKLQKEGYLDKEGKRNWEKIKELKQNHMIRSYIIAEEIVNNIIPPNPYEDDDFY